MHSEIARRDSFIRNRVFRRSTNLRATNEDLARAGLYATGGFVNLFLYVFLINGYFSYISSVIKFKANNMLRFYLLKIGIGVAFSTHPPVFTAT